MRSATTLVGQLVAASGGGVFLGELRETLAAESTADECDCGLRADACSYWIDVAARAERPSRATMWRTFRLTNIPAMIRQLRSARAGEQVSAWPVYAYYAAIADAVAPDAVIDTSKNAPGILVWRLAGEPVHVVHCLRNPWSVAREQANASTSPSGRPTRRSITTIRWACFNLGALLLAPFTASYTLVTYRRVLRDPAGTLARITRAQQGRWQVAPGTRDYAMRRTHALVGNPRRVKSGMISVRPPH